MLFLTLPVVSYLDKFVHMLIEYTPRLLLGILILYLGLKIINQGTRWLDSLMVRNKLDSDLRPFLCTLVGVLLKVLLGLSAAEIIGIETTSFIAILAAAGFAVGLALQGSLSNFSSGVLILLFKPFKTGDLIATQGFIGFVKEIQILNTILITLNHRHIIIPNSLLTSGVIENITGAGVVRIDMIFSASYNDDIDRIRLVLEDVMNQCPYAVHDDRYTHEIEFREMTASSLDFAMCIWCEGKDYWSIQYYLNEQVKKRFDKEGISIPYPQMDVHVHKTEPSV